MNRFLVILLLAFIFIEAQEHKTVSIFDNMVSIQLSKDIGTMPNEMFVLKYPYLNESNTEPYANEDATVCMVFTMMPDAANQNMLDSLKVKMAKQINGNSAASVFKSEMLTINGRKIIKIQFVSKAVDSEVLNFAIATDCNGKLLTGSFSCTMAKAPEWETVGHKIIESLKVNK